MKQADSQDEAEPGAPEAAGPSERRRPSRLLVVAAALTLGAVVGGVAILSRADTSVRVPDLIGKPADPVGDNLVFAADTAGLAADVVDVTDCRVRDTNVVVKQTPAPGTRVSAGTVVSVFVCRTPDPKHLSADSPSPSPVAVPIGDLPDAGVVVGTGHGDVGAGNLVTFIDLDGKIIATLRGYDIAGNPGSPGVWLQRDRNYFSLDAARGMLVPVSAHAAPIYDEGPEPKLAVPPKRRNQYGETVGHWRYAYRSPSGITLAEWSGECEAATAYWIDQTGTARIVTGERNVSNAPESLALGWTPDQRAVVYLPTGYCAGSGNPPGIYLYASPGEGTLIFKTKQDSFADMWGI